MNKMATDGTLDTLSKKEKLHFRVNARS